MIKTKYSNIGTFNQENKKKHYYDQHNFYKVTITLGISIQNPHILNGIVTNIPLVTNDKYYIIPAEIVRDIMSSSVQLYKT